MPRTSPLTTTALGALLWGNPRELRDGVAVEPKNLTATYRAPEEPQDRGHFPYVYLDGVVLKRSWRVK